MPNRTRAQERIDEIDVSPTKLVADIEQLQGELAGDKAKSEEYLAGLQRERAEFSNYRRRTTEEREQMLGLAGEDLIRKVLAIADDFDLAIENRPAELGGQQLGRGRHRDRPQAAGPARQRGRQARRSRSRQAVRSPRARGDRQRARAPAGPRARSSTSSGAGTSSAIASCGRRSSPWPRLPSRAAGRSPRAPTDPLHHQHQPPTTNHA